MNITLSAEKKLVERTRQFATDHGTSLNQIIRDYMRRVARLSELERDAEEFERLALSHGGHSPADFVFNREEAHRR